MIKLSNGHTFEYMAASGALAFDGMGWPWEAPLRWMGLLDPTCFTIVIKTLTRHPRRGNLRWYNPLGCIRLLQGGTVNAVGLTNPGIEWWCHKIGQRVDAEKISLMGSILGEPEELATMAQMLNKFDLVGLELNASCPNTSDDILKNTDKVIESCQRVRETSNFPIILKLSVVHDVEKIVRKTEGIVEAYSINSVPWSMIYPNSPSPLARFGGGGVSGKVVQSYTWKLLRELKTMTSTPVIAPSIWDFEDIATLQSMGASAVSFGAIFLRYPWRPTLFVRRKEVKRG